MRTWFVTRTFARTKKKQEHFLTWIVDTPVDPGVTVVASDLPLYMDMMELGSRVARAYRL